MLETVIVNLLAMKWRYLYLLKGSCVIMSYLFGFNQVDLSAYSRLYHNQGFGILLSSSFLLSRTIGSRAAVLKFACIIDCLKLLLSVVVLSNNCFRSNIYQLGR